MGLEARRRLALRTPAYDILSWDYPVKGCLLRRVTREQRRHDYETMLRLLREVRRAANVTQAELALTLDRPQSFVSKYETGERRLDVIELRNVCRALGLGVVEFMAQLDAELDSGRQP